MEARFSYDKAAPGVYKAMMIFPSGSNLVSAALEKFAQVRSRTVSE